MKFDASFMFSELRPPKDAQAKINCCRVQRIDIAFNLYFKIMLITALPGFFNQNVGKLFKDFVIAPFVGFTQISASNSRP
jgi:hypothetical protein